MDPINLILSVLAAGALTALQETASQAIKDTYQTLKSLILSKIKDAPKNELILSEYEKDPETWEKPLIDILKRENIDKDQKIVEVAKQLENLLNPRGNETKSDFNIGAIRNSKGIVIGDKADVTMNFGEGSHPQRKKRK